MRPTSRIVCRVCIFVTVFLIAFAYFTWHDEGVSDEPRSEDRDIRTFIRKVGIRSESDGDDNVLRKDLTFRRRAKVRQQLVEESTTETSLTDTTTFAQQATLTTTPAAATATTTVVLTTTAVATTAGEKPVRNNWFPSTTKHIDLVKQDEATASETFVKKAAAMKAVQDARRKVYSDYCQREDNELFTVFKKPRSVDRPTAMFAVEPYRIIYGRLPKVGCTNWKRTLAYMQTVNNATQRQNLINGVYGEDIHGKISSLFINPYNLQNRKTYPQPDDVVKRLREYFKFIFVRHPLDRLLSAYNSKFNTTKYFKGTYMKSYGPYIIQNFSKRQVQGIPDHITFEEFLRYAGETEFGWYNRHWAPYYHVCNLCQSDWTFDFIGKYEAMSDEANYLLELWGVHNMTFPPAYRTMDDEIARFNEAFANIPQSVIDKIYERYYPDFAMFGYSKYPTFKAK